MESKPQTVVLKNIYGNYTKEDILEELKNMNIENVTIIRITPIECKKSKFNKKHFIIQISPQSKKKNLTQIKKIASQDAMWEHLIKNNILQCKNCQRLGHTSSQCHMTYRCVKCGRSDHERGKCPINLEKPKTNLKCVNCGETGHPASYAGCPFRKFVK
ncbi:GSCOCG00012688001-RA-CDS, partial [Cotesia congregata]